MTSPHPPRQIPLRRRRISRGLILSAVIPALPLFYVLYCAGMYYFQDWMLFPRISAPPGEPRLLTPATERLLLKVDDGSDVEAWFCPAPGASRARPAPVLFYFHGNLEIIDEHRELVERFNRLGCSVVLPEYRGYGRSKARPTEDGILEDMLNFHDRILARPDVDASRVAYYGNSLGSAAAVALSAQRLPRAMILGAAFTSVPDMARRFYAPGFVARYKFDTEKTLRTLDVPVLIAHGAEDTVVPISQAHRLRSAARRPTYLEFPSGHVGFNRSERFWRRVTRFLRENGILPGQPS